MPACNKPQNTPGNEAIVLLAIAFLVSRLFLILFAIDKFFLFEELHTGVCAKDFFEGLRWRLLTYQDMQHSGEVLLLGVLGLPFFLCLGPSLFSLKLAVITLHLGMYGAILAFLFRFFSREVAVITGLLFIFAPPAWLWWSLVPIYQHAECMLFVFLGFYFLFRILYETDNRPADYILFGLISGIGLWYTLSFLVAIVTFLLVWWLVDRKTLFSRKFLYVPVFFLLGYGLRIYQILEDRLIAFSVYGDPFYQPFFSVSGLSSLKNLLNLLLNLPQSLGFSHRIFSYIYFILPLISFGIVLWKRRGIFKALIYPLAKIGLEKPETKEAVLLIYPAIFFLVLGFSNPIGGDSPDGYRYLAPLYPFFIIFIAMLLSSIRGQRTKVAAMTFTFLFTLVFTISVMGYLSFFSIKSAKVFSKTLKYQGYSYKVFDWLYSMKVAAAFKQNPQIINSIEAGHTHVFYEELIISGVRLKVDADKIAAKLKNKYQYRQLYFNALGRTHEIRLADKTPVEYRGYFYEGAGLINFDTYAIVLSDFTLTDEEKQTKLLAALKEQIDFSRQIPPIYLPYFYEGLGRGIGRVYASSEDERMLVEMINSIYYPYREYFCIGLGRYLGWTLGDNLVERSGLINMAPEQYRSFLYQGLGLEYAYEIWDGLKKPLDIVNIGTMLPEGPQKDFYRGLGRGVKWISIDDNSLRQKIFPIIPSPYQPCFVTGMGFPQ